MSIYEKLLRQLEEGRNRVFECSLKIYVKARDKDDAKTIAETIVQEPYEDNPYWRLVVKDEGIVCREVDGVEDQDT